MKKRIIAVVVVLIVIGLGSFYLVPTNLINNILNTSDYRVSVNGETKLLSVGRMFDPSLLSEEAQAYLIENEIVNTDNTLVGINTFPIDDLIDLDAYRSIIASIKLSRRFYTPKHMSFGKDEIAFEIGLSSEYRMLIGPGIQQVSRVGKSVPYYKVTNSEEVVDKLIKAINDSIAKRVNNSN